MQEWEYQSKQKNNSYEKNSLNNASLSKYRIIRPRVGSRREWFDKVPMSRREVDWIPVPSKHKSYIEPIALRSLC